jgi:hypothetical protein
VGDFLSKVNLFSLLVILFVNLVVGFSFKKYGQVPNEELSKVQVAHFFWTANWLLWLLSWFAIAYGQSQAAVILNDLGAFCLVACAIAFSSGMVAVKKYVPYLCSFFVIDVIYMLTVNVLVHGSGSKISNQLSIIFPPDVPVAQYQQWVNGWISDVIHHHTVLFGPSLCLTMLALGLVSWTLATRSTHFELGIAFGFIGALYAFAQITIYQNGLLVPFLTMTDRGKYFLIGWRILFVTSYWLAMMAAAGIVIAGARIWSVVGTAAGLIGSIGGLIGALVRKH